jgi:HEAT repeat protein
MAPESAAARRALVALLEDKDWRVRQAAARILGEVGPAAKESVPDLIRLLQDKYGDVRWAAAKALGEMGPAA